MTNSFLLSRLSVITSLESVEQGRYFFYSETRKGIIEIDERNKILIDGQILPSINENEDFSNFSISELLKKLFLIYGLNFIHHIKGQFIIVVFNPDTFQVFTNRSGIKKVFIGRQGSNFLITNNLNSIKNAFRFEPDKTGILNYCLFNNFLEGSTFFSNLSVSAPALHISYDDELNISTWFDYRSFLNGNNEHYSIPEIADNIFSVISNCNKFLNTKKAFITLTGGMDSRLALSMILKSGLNVSGLVYGDPASKDVIFASSIANTVNLDLETYYWDNPSESFVNAVDEIIETGNGMISIHRAHRLSAYQKFSKDHGSDGTIFTGHMGGELIRNFFYDGIIVNPLAEYYIKHGNLNYRSSVLMTSSIDSFFNDQSIGYINKVYFDYLNSLPLFSLNRKWNEYQFTFKVLTNMHHSQDIMLACKYFDNVYPVFIDDDFIDLIFKTGNSFIANYIQKRKFYNLLMGQKIYCELIRYFYPELAEIPFGKRGSYTALECLNDTKLFFLAKRAKRYIAERTKYRPNFSYGSWFHNYLLNELGSIRNNEILKEIFNIDRFGQHLYEDCHGTTEGYWRKYSNIIFINKVLRHFIPSL